LISVQDALRPGWQRQAPQALRFCATDGRGEQREPRADIAQPQSQGDYSEQPE